MLRLYHHHALRLKCALTIVLVLLAGYATGAAFPFPKRVGEGLAKRVLGTNWTQHFANDSGPLGPIVSRAGALNPVLIDRSRGYNTR